MNFKQSFLLSIKSIMSSKTRSMLTMLGIIIGVAAVIVIVSLGQGMSKSMTETFESMGTNLITVMLRGRGSTRTVTVDDMYGFAEQHADSIAAVTPFVTLSTTAKYESASLDTTVNGVGEDYCQIRNYAVASGRFIEYIDIARRQKVCVIGTYVSQTLFEDADPLGKAIRINGDTYTVVGLLDKKSSNEEGTDDDQIIIPYTNAAKLARRTITTFYFSTVSTSTVSDAMTGIKDKLFEVYENENAYFVRSQAESIERLTTLTDTMMMVLVAIAAISLLVGGIGIMNIMLVSVSERTREIGIRKSVGAKKKDIMRQFVIEAATTSSVGGIFGIIIGIIFANIAAKVFNLSASPSILAIATAFLVSLSIGIAFGYLPANKAAKLNPIDALRYD